MTITIGQRLKEAREDKHLTLEKAFEATRIRVQYLQALEEDDLSVMPSPVQARGYLRNYAEYLGLDVEKVLEELREANAQTPAEVVIGPADASTGEETPAVQPETAAVVKAPVEEALLIKPKPARRKKTGSQTGGNPVPKQRGRNKAEPELVPASQIEPSDVILEKATDQSELPAEESLTPSGETSQPQALLPQDDHSGSLLDSEPIPELIPEEARVEPHLPAEAQPEPETGDSHWQTWMNRLSSILSARNRRPTLVPREPLPSEGELNPPIPASELPEAADAESKTPAESSTEIFKEIGRDLRERRELLSLHFEEVERNTHVKAHYLDALERGAMDDLPSTVQTRGMLSNYATFLDLDVDTLLLRFADALQARHRERNPQRPARKPGQPILAGLPPMRTFIAGDLVFGVGIVVLLVGFAVWGVSRVLTLQSQQNVNPTAPSISDVLLAPPGPSSFTATPTQGPLEAFPGEATVTVVIPTLNVSVNVQVNLVAVERTYMRVIVDGETAYEGRVVPGTAYPFDAVDRVEVLVGSGAAIRVVYNGRDLGLLGSFGQVVSNIYRVDGIVTPTGMPTASATVTPTPTNTVPPSATSQLTSSPAPTATP